MNLYITADEIGQQSGGGLVTRHELTAIKTLGDTEVWDRGVLNGVDILHEEALPDPFGWDQRARIFTQRNTLPNKYHGRLELAHFYAGTFSDTVEELQGMGVKITYTAAAHDIEVSKREHEKLGMSFTYPHLTYKPLWDKYVKGYLNADVLICPSTHSAGVMRGFGYSGRLEVIPHGVDQPKEIKPFPKGLFVAGYLGACGPDKGLPYLLQAWKKLNYKDAVLRIAGRDSCSPYMIGMVKEFGGGNIHLAGWQNSVSDFYGDIHLYIQPSATEGFGIEVLEAMAHGRPVLCSAGAGASDVLLATDFYKYWVFPACDVEALAEKLDVIKTLSGLEAPAKAMKEHSKNYSWDKIRQRYVDVWRSLL